MKRAEGERVAASGGGGPAASPLERRRAQRGAAERRARTRSPQAAALQRGQGRASAPTSSAAARSEAQPSGAQKRRHEHGAANQDPRGSSLARRARCSSPKASGSPQAAALQRGQGRAAPHLERRRAQRGAAERSPKRGASGVEQRSTPDARVPFADRAPSRRAARLRRCSSSCPAGVRRELQRVDRPWCRSIGNTNERDRCAVQSTLAGSPRSIENSFPSETIPQRRAARSRLENSCAVRTLVNPLACAIASRRRAG